MREAQPQSVASHPAQQWGSMLFSGRCSFPEKPELAALWDPGPALRASASPRELDRPLGEGAGSLHTPRGPSPQEPSEPPWTPAGETVPR